MVKITVNGNRFGIWHLFETRHWFVCCDWLLVPNKIKMIFMTSFYFLECLAWIKTLVFAVWNDFTDLINYPCFIFYQYQKLFSLQNDHWCYCQQFIFVFAFLLFTPSSLKLLGEMEENFARIRLWWISSKYLTWPIVQIMWFNWPNCWKKYFVIFNLI